MTDITTTAALIVIGIIGLIWASIYIFPYGNTNEEIPQPYAK